jgi:predicted nucleotidyltransferase
MGALADATLTPLERRVLERFVRQLEADLGDRLRSVWLYGSRARGEQPGPESDVDVLVIASGVTWNNYSSVSHLLYSAAEEEGANPVLFSVHVYDPERLAHRREIKSFFIQEVDRDKIVLYGEP